MGPITVETLTSPESIRAIEPEWTALLNACPHRAANLTPWWMTAFWTHRVPDNPLRVVLVREEGRLALVAPMMGVKVRTGPVTERWLQSLAGYESGGADFIYTTPRRAYFDGFWDAVERERDWDCVAFWQLPLASPTQTALLRSAEARGLRFRRIPESPGWVVRTDGPWPAFERTLDRKFRENLRRRRRKLEADHGRVALRRVTDAPGLAAAIGPLSALGLRAASSKGRNALGPLHEALMAAAAARGHLLLDMLEVDGRAIAFNVQFHLGGRVTSLVIGYDPAFAAYGAGHLVQLDSLESNFRDPGLALYDLMAGGTDHKKDWTASTEGSVKLYVYSRRARGRALRVAHAVGSELKQNGVRGLAGRLGEVARDVRRRMAPPRRLRTARIRVNGAALLVEVAATAEERTQGLMYRRRLAPNGGMLFVSGGRVAEVWMKNTSLALDLAFALDDGTITAIHPLHPGSTLAVRSPGPIAYWLEVPRGWFHEHRVAVGDRLEIPPSLEARPATAPSPSGEST